MLPSLVMYGFLDCHPAVGLIPFAVIGTKGSIQAIPQRLPSVISHHDEGLPVIGFGDLMNGANVRVVDGCGGLCLAYESGGGLIIQRELLRKEFERDVSIQLRITRLEDDAHAASSEFFYDLIVCDAGARNRNGHRKGQVM